MPYIQHISPDHPNFPIWRPPKSNCIKPKTDEKSSNKKENKDTTKLKDWQLQDLKDNEAASDGVWYCPAEGCTKHYPTPGERRSVTG